MSKRGRLAPFAARYWHAMAYDAGRGVTVLFGAVTGGANNGETWEWNGTDWTQRAVNGPSPRRWHAMVYDMARGVTVLFGGYTTIAPNGETWEWNGKVRIDNRLIIYLDDDVAQGLRDAILTTADG